MVRLEWISNYNSGNLDDSCTQLNVGFIVTVCFVSSVAVLSAFVFDLLKINIY